MDERFAVPDWGQDPEDYLVENYSYWVGKFKKAYERFRGDALIAIERREINSIGRQMFSNNFTNDQCFKAHNEARVLCGLLSMERVQK